MDLELKWRKFRFNGTEYLCTENGSTIRMDKTWADGEPYMLVNLERKEYIGFRVEKFIRYRKKSNG